jgi:hypothetical protein
MGGIPPLGARRTARLGDSGNFEHRLNSPIPVDWHGRIQPGEKEYEWASSRSAE